MRFTCEGCKRSLPLQDLADHTCSEQDIAKYATGAERFSGDQDPWFGHHKTSGPYATCNCEFCKKGRELRRTSFHSNQNKPVRDCDCAWCSKRRETGLKSLKVYKKQDS